jgi:hypothetical protein
MTAPDLRPACQCGKRARKWKTRPAIATDRGVKIEQAGDTLDDVIGPMVNRLVNVSVVRGGQKAHLIETSKPLNQ